LINVTGAIVFNNIFILADDTFSWVRFIDCLDRAHTPRQADHARACWKSCGNSRGPGDGAGPGGDHRREERRRGGHGDGQHNGLQAALRLQEDTEPEEEAL
jgi:hypothetical protein